METTGERIKRYRETAGLTQEELATKIKTSAQNIYKYEKGIIRNIPLNKIQALSDIFGITPTQLVGWGAASHDQFKKPVEITTLSEDEKTLITLYRQASYEYQGALLNLLKVSQNCNTEYETKRDPEITFNSPYLRLASEMPEYKFSGNKKDK